MNSTSPWPPALCGLLLLAAGGWMARSAEEAREPEARAARGLPSLGVVSLVARDLLWVRADGLFAEGRWAEMTTAYEAVGWVEPRLPDTWEYRGWHLAYNVAGEVVDPAERARWVVAGVDVLREGLRANPRAADLRRFLAMTLRDRARRWPEVRRALARAAGGRDPVDEAVDLHREATALDPTDSRARWSLAETLVDRALDALRMAPADEAVPAAAKDLAEAAALYRAMAGEAGDFAPVFEDLATAAEQAAVAAGPGRADERRALLAK